ncbi:hypothetical protein ULMS_13670 [Patiriisocius marinistellae]|uniref:DUF349 domain-containing protein n=1 Tax=Patiriisocius marinistellae TaxID=2494560 RepID=A0A5J4G076_9FLAO|nr:DUF349 domain-containing protein [Patiriisocius marinistellae]GEQ85859.1 hypothetical protein ULMS_13670 [Patiriisocius marinistellae]
MSEEISPSGNQNDKKTTDNSEITSEINQAETTAQNSTSDSIPSEIDTPETSAVVEKATEKPNTTPETSIETPSKEVKTTEVVTMVEKSDSDTSSDVSEENEVDEEEIETSDDINETDEIEIPEVDYSELSMPNLTEALNNLVTKYPVQKIKDPVDEIKNEFNNQFQELLKTKKEEFLAEGGNIIDFHYESSEKKAFNEAFSIYRAKKNAYYNNLKKSLESNLVTRTALIEELKALVETDESVNKNYKKLKDIQERWRDAGAIPRDKYNTVWNNYHHHVDNYYNALHLDNEFRELDFKHNLEEKQKLIKHTEELAEESDINKAFRELQLIHRKWKEEIGPVAREVSDEIWEKFSAASRVIHDKKEQAEAALEDTFKANYSIKKELIGLIDKVKAEAKPTHKAWQESMKQVQEIRDIFFTAGRVPRDKNKEIWASFKDTMRNFNKAKNDFYKNQKNQQFENLEKKRALIAIAEEHKDSEDYKSATQLMKKVQADWRKIGHVPRNESDKVWKQFKKACNHYFDRLNALKDEENKEEVVNLEQKTVLLDATENLELTGDHKVDITAIKEKITEWKSIGRVPFKKKSIDQKFNKVLDGLFGKLDLDKKEAELIKFENKVNSMVSQDDDRQLQNEQFFLSKKVDEVQAEISQLENNLGFFRHVDDDNPLVKDVHKNIAKHKEQLALWKQKYSKIKAMRAAKDAPQPEIQEAPKSTDEALDTEA